MARKALTEFETIEIIREMLSGPAPGLVVGPGDDAAVFDFTTNSIILTVDAIHEGVHFTLDAYDLSDVGWKAVASSVSDVAAMGGEPACALISAAFGQPPTEPELRSLLGGAIEMSDQCHCPIVGGDVCSSKAGLSLTVTVAGTPNPSGSILRSGAREGDLIGVTGVLGDSAGGLYVLKSRSDGLRAAYPGLVEAHLRPRPRVSAGVALAAAGVSAMADVSDGLARDLSNICRASKAGCEVHLENVPVSDALRELAAEALLDPVTWALSGGEDYELVFTAAPEGFEEVAGALAALGVHCSLLGTVTGPASGMRLVSGDGEVTEMEGLGYDHFL